MGGGYVCNFSDRSFGNFIVESVGVDVYTPAYAKGGTSKANRLRTFWRSEPNSLVVKLMTDMLAYWKSEKERFGNFDKATEELYLEGVQIVERLRQASPIDDADAFKPNSSDADFATLAASIRESIDKGRPSDALDRLHTFLVRYIRELCRKHNIPFEKNTPLQSLFGGYTKFLIEQGLIESEMSERILKSSISVLDAFNSVRNNQSFAHDNPILNHNEAVLIFNNISNVLRFIESIEHKIAEKAKEQTSDEISWGDISFSEEEIQEAGDAWIELQAEVLRGVGQTDGPA